MKKISRLLIANRGEIAVRIIKTAKQMGIFTVSVYTRNDEASLHVKFADKAVLLEDDHLENTFLSAKKMIEVALNEQCDAIHPGYGFISENPEFPRLCVENGLIFIGPTAQSMELLGNKVKARSFVKSIGVPVISGISGSVDELLESAKYLDFPIMIKPLAGGGGKGIFVVNQAHDLPEYLQKAGREAQNYFNNSKLYVEHYFEKARHIEVQLLGDQFGNLIHLYERECSLQRRFQKIFEEAPSPTISEKTRKNFLDAAVKIGKAVGYQSAGTIEFLVDRNENFYFLEMNTRIQVEHGVTELITGIDLVKEQLKIASGEKLEWNQNEIAIEGHAIEARIYAENIYNDFMPVQGKILKQNLDQIKGVRIDTHIADNMILPQTYDSLLAKVLVKDKNRAGGIKKLAECLGQTEIFGIENNLAYLLQLVIGDDFKNNLFYTKYIEKTHNESKGNLLKLKEESSHVLAIAYTLVHFIQTKKDPNNVWEQIGYQRLKNEINVQVNGKDVYLSWEKRAKGIDLSVEGNGFSLSDYQINEPFVSFHFENQKYQLSYLKENGCTYVHYLGMSIKLTSNSILSESTIVKKSKKFENNREIKINSPLFGRVVVIHVKESDRIKKGDVLMVIEAMKTENTILSPISGFVERVNIRQNEQVEEGQLMALILPSKKIVKKLELN